MDTKLSKILSHRGYAWRRVLLIIFVTLLAFLLLLVLPFSPLPIHLAISHTENLVHVSHSDEELYNYYDMMDDKHNSSSIERAIVHDQWALAHLHGDFGLQLVNYAASSNRLGVLKMLIARGAPVNGVIDVDGNAKPMQTTPLDEAIISDHPRAVSILMAAGADPSERFSMGNGMGMRTPYQDAFSGKVDPKIVAIMKSVSQARNHAVQTPATRR